jgi:cation transport regulator ChaB
MPYASTAELPENVRKLPAKKQRQFMAAFNSAFIQYKDEKRAFATAWSAVNKTAVANEIVFKAADKPKQILYCVVLEPATEDLQGDVTDETEIEKAAHQYLLDSRVIGDSHQKDGYGNLFKVDAGVVESFIAPTDYEVSGEKILKGSWVIAIKVYDTEVWKSIEAGEITGVSIGGFGERVPYDD